MVNNIQFKIIDSNYIFSILLLHADYHISAAICHLFKIYLYIFRYLTISNLIYTNYKGNIQ